MTVYVIMIPCDRVPEFTTSRSDVDLAAGHEDRSWVKFNVSLQDKADTAM